ncbi:MAG: Repeat family, partial [Planctomycetaceae bacterium]|nr:Repeat family [Planctomycetaceae bacterium]
MIFHHYWSWLAKLSSAARLSRGRVHQSGNGRRKVRLRCGWTIERLDQRIVPTQLIAVPNHHDIIYNDADHILYTTTQQGTIERYNTDTQTSLTPWTVGGVLYGADITLDGHWMYVGDRVQHSTTEGVVHKVNLTTGQVTDLIYPNNPGEGGSYDVAILPNGIALFSSVTDGPAGFVTMRQIDLATDVITARTDFGSITELTQFDMNPDRSLVYVKSSGPYGGGVGIYSTATNSVIGGFNAHTNPQYAMGSFSRDGSQYVFEFGGYPAIINAAGDTLHLFQNLTGGVAFDPQHDILYIGDDSGDELRAYDTHTWDLLYTMSAGENIVNSVPLEQGEIRFGNGKIFMETLQGVRVFTPPAPTVTGVHLQIDGFVGQTAINFNVPMTVSARDASGNILTNYAGTVHFTTNDGSSILPADYTFTGADAGVHTFPIVFSTLGLHELNVTDTATANLSTRVGGISVQSFAPQPNVLPIIGSDELIYEASRHTLYMPTVTGYIERYDVTNQTMLPAWAIGGHLLGADLSLDGRYLYVADQVKSGHEGIIHKIDLDTGDDVDLAFGITSYEGGAFDISIDANGLAFITTSFLGSGPVYLRQLDTATDIISVVESSPGVAAEIPQSTLITHGADRSVLLLSASFGEGFWVYYSDTQSFGPGVGLGRFLDSAPSAINRNGSLVAVSHQSPIVVYDRNLQPVTTLAGQGTDGSVAFDPLRDIMYVVNSDLDELRAYDTNTWAMLFSQPFGEDIHVYGQLTVSSDGAHAFFTRGELVRIYNLPAPPSLQIGNATTTEGQTGQKSVQLTVTLSAAVSSAVTVDYSTVSGTATAGSDFDATTGTITFAPNQTTQTITVLINGDNAAEADETFQVILSNPQNALIADGQAIITIVNNDSGLPPTISGLDSQITVLENAVNSAPQLLDSDVTFSDPDNLTLQGGNLNVAITSGGSAEDQLGVQNQGTSAGQIGVIGTTVTFGGVTFATITNTGANGGMLVVSFTTSAATPAAIDALIKNLTYRNTSDAPQPTRVISLVVTDNFGTPGPASTTTLAVTPQNDPPSLSTIANRTITEDTTAAISFTVGDDETPVSSLVVTVTSSNHALLPDANAVLTGTTGSRTITVTPLLNQSGTSTITVTVNDGALQTTKTFLLTVTSVDDTPTISDQGNQSTNEDVALTPLPFTIGDVDTPLANLTVTTSSSNLALVPLSGIVITGSGATRTVQVTPSANQSGVTTITLTVSDGNSSSSDAFSLTVISLPDAPTISHIPDRTTNEDVAPPAQSFIIGDTDSPLNTLTVTAHSSNPAVVPDANILLSGSGASRTLNVTPLPNQSGTVSVTLTVSDGTQSSQDTFTLTILP